MKHNKEHFIAWLKEQSWVIKNVRDTLYKEVVVDWPHQPDIIATKFNETCCFWVASKGMFPYSKKHECNVTGIDYPKYRFAREYQNETGLKSMLIFKSEDGMVIAKQLDQLPKPAKWFGSCDWISAPYQCQLCFKNNRNKYNLCKRSKRKPIAIWRIKEFTLEAVTIQSSLL